MEGVKVKRCGLCSKFHTLGCPSETTESVREKAYYQNGNSEPLNPNCFELDLERTDLISLFSKIVLENFTVKHLVKGDSSLGLFKWENGRFAECEEFLKAFVERAGEELGLQDRVRTHVVNETIEKVKRLTYFELEEEPLKIAFKNYAFDWKVFLNGPEEPAEEPSYLTPIEATKEEPIFHLIPHNLNVDYFKEGLAHFDIEKGVIPFVEEMLPDIVKIFKDWVGDKWPLLFEIIGYCLYPDYPFNKAFMLVGSGSNGKTTFLNLINVILGEGNTVSISLQDICLYRFAPCELYHKLANIFSDLPAKPIGYTGFFKVLTGQDVLSAPRKFRDSIRFRNYAKLIFSANELPEVSDMSDAFWRRWIVIEFPNKFPDNPTFFEENFTEEVIEKIIVAGILAFANVYKNRKFSVEAGPTDFKEQWLRMANSVYAYVQEGLETKRLSLSGEAYTPSDELYQDYVSWCRDNDLEAQTKNMFTRELERLFKIVKRRRMEGGQRFYAYEGVALKTEEEADLQSFYSCEKCGGKATTRLFRDGREVWLCGSCLKEWEGNL